MTVAWLVSYMAETVTKINAVTVAQLITKHILTYYKISPVHCLLYMN